jgi:hypothetical protein
VAFPYKRQRAARVVQSRGSSDQHEDSVARAGGVTPSVVANYPRTYRVIPVARRVMTATALALIAAGVAGHVLPLYGIGHRSNDLLSPIFSNAVLATVAVNILYKANRRVTLFQDAIEVPSWLSVRRLTHGQIRARRIQRGYRLNWHHVLIPVDPHQHELHLPGSLATDATFTEWLRPIPRMRS